MNDEDNKNAMIREYRNNAAHLLEIIVLQAPIIRAKYNALVKEGFSEDQALQLCKGPLIQ